MRHSLSTAALLGSLALAACTEGLQIPTAPPPPAIPTDAPVFTVSAYAGVLVINEVMADPSAVSDADGEWLEIHNRSNAAVNIQNWALVGNNDGSHTIASSVSVPARGYVVLARNGTSGSNGGVTEDYVYGSAMTMANSSDWVALRDGGGASVDSVTWASTLTAGYTRGVTDPDADNLTVTGSNWHTAAVVYGAGDRGTPGAQNDGRRSALTVRIMEVGQADAIYITNGLSRVLVDGGQSMSNMASLISEFGLASNTLDMIILSHAHLDHHGGMREFFKATHNITIPFFYENKDAATGTTIAELRDSINARVGRGVLTYRDTDDPCTTGASICTILLDGGARLHIMKPKTSDSNANNRSAPLKLVGPDSASFTMWLSGDAEHAALDWFLNTANYDAAPGMNVDVLKSNHHGSCNGVSTAFLNAITPAWATMGVSSTNGFEHVHEQTKDLLTSLSIPWLRTDENGRITFTSPGTIGGGYSVTYVSGSASMDGDADDVSAQEECDEL